MKMTKAQFLEKLEIEGGAEGMFYYIGSSVDITDNSTLDEAWFKFCSAYNDLLYHMEEED
jgi:hypothetical protein